jgi:hypothetical protein
MARSPAPKPSFHERQEHIVLISAAAEKGPFGGGWEATRKPVVGVQHDLKRLAQIMSHHGQQHGVKVVRLLKRARSRGV